MSIIKQMRLAIKFDSRVKCFILQHIVAVLGCAVLLVAAEPPTDPQQSGGTPGSQYGAPHGGAPAPQYGAPAGGGRRPRPSSQYGAPNAGYEDDNGVNITKTH